MQQYFEFHPSRYLTAMLVAAHCAVLAVLAAILPLWAALAAGALLLFSLSYYLGRDAWLRLPSSCAGLVLDGDGVILHRRDGVKLPGKILHDSLVTPALTVLNVLPHGARFARGVVILPDSLEAESFRQLRVWLRWGSHREPLAAELQRKANSQ